MYFNFGVKILRWFFLGKWDNYVNTKRRCNSTKLIAECYQTYVSERKRIKTRGYITCYCLERKQVSGKIPNLNCIKVFFEVVTCLPSSLCHKFHPTAPKRGADTRSGLDSDLIGRGSFCGGAQVYNPPSLLLRGAPDRSRPHLVAVSVLSEQDPLDAFGPTAVFQFWCKNFKMIFSW